MSESTSVYRCYGAGGKLLYVGCSKNVKKRLQMHRSQSKWFSEMMHHKIRVYPDRKTALAVEERAMRILKPEVSGIHPYRLPAIEKQNREAWEKAAGGKGRLAELSKQALALPNCPKETKA